ncbi:hypothetical protein DSL61_18285 [Vibrio cholerae]|nr:hypothetical protein DSL61_18285 [Vibrio cholerae]
MGFFILPTRFHHQKWSGKSVKMSLRQHYKKFVVQKTHNKRLKRDSQRAAFPVPLSRGGFGCCV